MHGGLKTTWTATNGTDSGLVRAAKSYTSIYQLFLRGGGGGGGRVVQNRWSCYQLPRRLLGTQEREMKKIKRNFGRDPGGGSIQL